LQFRGESSRAEELASNRESRRRTCVRAWDRRIRGYFTPMLSQHFYDAIQ